jgi:peptide/nickel transport system permease protein
MLQYVVRRLLQSVVVLWGVTLLVFALLFLSGDPAALLVSPTASRAEVDA